MTSFRIDRPCQPGAYMSQEQLDFFEARLLHWRRDLCRLLDRNAKPAQLETRLPDWIDAAALNSQLELSFANRERAWHFIREIDAALARIKDGSYGFCCESGEEIGLKRLAVMPTARFSVTAQQELELRGRLYR